MSDQSKPPVQGQQIQIDIDEATAQGAYANLVFINHTDAEFVLDFVFVQPGVPRARIRSRIVSSPRHTKRMLRALEANIARYEQVFGKIEEVGPAPPIEPNSIS